ncbi:hypothetical protein PGT21_005486 [Puccinia graminis f. sp. tritici]|uniref:Uncharacterized protein n=1 Tax=Puccinia graminis f. sp. tritici TaxID=56615 RepID=A0A5B0N2S5_PUCGR|nr:hypothetical protein PGT21_005486 [Puccinia graminis f. sp. tritici]KAA1082279.1 hypothetical protein PGTUg99_031231 [Puccinia graminis f. sp. tritici]
MSRSFSRVLHRYPPALYVKISSFSNYQSIHQVMSIFKTGLVILAFACLLSVVEGDCAFRCFDGVSNTPIGMCVTMGPDPKTGKYISHLKNTHNRTLMSFSATDPLIVGAVHTISFLKVVTKKGNNKDNTGGRNNTPID